MASGEDMRRRLALTMLAALYACGRLQFDSVDDASMFSSDVPPTGPFGVPVLVAGLADPAFDDDPTATADLLELYFSSERPGGAGGMADIFRASRLASTDSWGPALPVAELNSASFEDSPGISPDGLTIYFSSDRLDGVQSDIFISTRATRSDSWSAPTRIAELSSSSEDYQAQPTLVALRLVLYRNLMGNRDLFEATRSSSAAAWPPPQPIAELNGPGAETSPCLSSDAGTILFGSDRASGTPDIHDLFEATRPSLGEPFGTPQQLAVVNSAGDDDDPWLSPDGHVLYFSSDRSGNSEIYEAQR